MISYTSITPWLDSMLPYYSLTGPTKLGLVKFLNTTIHIEVRLVVVPGGT